MSTPPAAESVVELALELVAPHPFNERVLQPSDESLRELAQGIATIGVQEPIVVCPIPPEGREAIPDRALEYVIAFGHRRWFASGLAGRDTVPAIIRPLSWRDIFLVQVAENAAREDLSPMQQARKVQRLTTPVDEGGYGMSQREAARALGRSQPWVNRHRQLMRLPRDVQDAIDAGAISKLSGYELGKLDHVPHLIAGVIQEAQGQDEAGYRAAVDRVLADHPAPERAKPRGGRPRADQASAAEPSTSTPPIPPEEPPAAPRRAPVPLALRPQVRTTATVNGDNYRWLLALVGPRWVRQWVSAAVNAAIESHRAQVEGAADADMARMYRAYPGLKAELDEMERQLDAGELEGVEHEQVRAMLANAVANIRRQIGGTPVG